MNASGKLLIYTIVTLIVTVIGLIMCRKFIKKEGGKTLFLKIMAVVTVIIHYSDLWVGYFQNGSATINSTHILPVFPCNICMWLLVVCAFFKNKETKIYKILCEFTAFAGIVCGMIGIVFNENFLSNPDFGNYEVLKGLLSHSTMVTGALYLFVKGEIKINAINNTISVICGLSLFVAIGTIVNLLFSIFDLDPVNAMYMLEDPFPKYPFINFLSMGVAAVILVFLVTYIYEHVFEKKQAGLSLNPKIKTFKYNKKDEEKDYEIINKY